MTSKMSPYSHSTSEGELFAATPPSTIDSPRNRDEFILDIMRRGSHAGVIAQRLSGESESESDPSLGIHQEQVPTTIVARGQPAARQGNLFPDFSWTPSVHELTFTALQEWEGYVLDVTEDTFIARLVDLSEAAAVDEEAEFPITDVSEDEKQLLRPGAVFRWSIGYERTKGGTKRRVSQIVFRRLPRWTKRELEENCRLAEELGARLRSETNDREAGG